jgi:hypothetical protein
MDRPEPGGSSAKKNLVEVLRQKEAELQELQREVDALRVAARLLGEEPRPAERTVCQLRTEKVTTQPLSGKVIPRPLRPVQPKPEHGLSPQQAKIGPAGDPGLSPQQAKIGLAGDPGLREITAGGAPLRQFP